MPLIFVPSPSFLQIVGIQFFGFGLVPEGIVSGFGSIFIANCWFHDNKCPSVNSFGATVDISNSIFSNNSAHPAVVVIGNSDGFFSFNSVAFVNSSNVQGHIVLCVKGDVYVVDSVFADNIARLGGAMSQFDGSLTGFCFSCHEDADNCFHFFSSRAIVIQQECREIYWGLICAEGNTDRS